MAEDTSLVRSGSRVPDQDCRATIPIVSQKLTLERTSLFDVKCQELPSPVARQRDLLVT